MSAKEAAELGLVNRTSNPGCALEEAVKTATTISKNGLKAVRSARDLSYDDALEMETKQAVSLILSGECMHGIAAFLSGKKPDFPD